MSDYWMFRTAQAEHAEHLARARADGLASQVLRQRRAARRERRLEKRRQRAWHDGTRAVIARDART